MQSSKEPTTKSKRSNKRRNSRKKSLSPTNFKTLQQEYRSERRVECKRSLSEGSAKPKRRKSNIRRTLSHPFTERIPAKDVEAAVECASEAVVHSASEERDARAEPGAPAPPAADGARAADNGSDRDTEDERRARAQAPPALLRFGRQQFAADSGSDLESLAASTVRRVSVRRRRGTPDTGSSSAKEEFLEVESGRMRPEDYRLVFLSSDSSCKEDNEDSSSTASSAAPLFTEDCDWDYFEPGGAGAVRHVLPAAAPPPAPRAAAPCPRACSCGAEPRIVAVPVPVPVPVPAALWPALLVYPDAPDSARPWSLFDFPRSFPAFRNFDPGELARLASLHAAAAGSPAAADMAARERKVDAPAAPEPSVPSDGRVPEFGAGRPIADEDTPEFARLTREKDGGADRQKVPDVIEVAPEETIVRPEDVIEHLQAERAFSSSGDSAESTDGEREPTTAEGSYELAGDVPSEPPTSDAESDASSGPDEGRFSRVFVVNPAGSSSEDDDSSGIDCSEGEDRSGERYDDITIEEALLNARNGSSAPPPPAERTAAPPAPPPSAGEPIAARGTRRDDDRSSLKCSDFIKFCDMNMLQRADDSRGTIECVVFAKSQPTEGKTVTFSEENESHEPDEEKEKLGENAAGDSSARVKVKVSEAGDRSDGCVRESETQESKINLSTGVTASPVSRPSSPSTVGGEPLRQIDILKGIERTLSELLKNESSFERRQDEEKLLIESGVGGGAGDAEGARSPRSAACAPAAAAAAASSAAVSRPRSARADDSARYTSRVMITHDHVSVVSSDTTSVMRDVTVHHTNSQREERVDAESDPESEGGGVTVVTNADTLSAVVCLEEGLADDDSWVEDVSPDEDAATSPTESDSGDEAMISSGRGEDFTGFCRRSLDFTLHTIPEESCEESEPDHARRSRPISATELEKYFFFGIGDGRHAPGDEDEPEDASSACSDGGDSVAGREGSERGDDDAGDPGRLASSRLEKYFLSGFMGFDRERRDSDGSGSVGSDSEGRHSPEHRRKRLVRARGTPRSHSSSLDNLLAGDEAPPDAPDDSEGSSTETEGCNDSTERVDQGDKRKKGKKTRNSPADERRHSAEFAEEARDDARSISEGEEGGRASPRQEFPPLGSDLSESKKQTSRDSGFVGSCDDLLRSGDSSAELRAGDQKPELEEITEELRPEGDEGAAARAPSPLARKDSFNNWSSDEETNLMMTKMRQFFKTMVGTAPVRASTPAADTSGSTTPTSGGARRPPKPPQLLYFESELTRLMKTVPGIRDEEVREIVEYLSSEDTWSDSYDSSDYAGSDLEGPGAGRSALRRQISESCREIIDEFDRGVEREPDGAVGGALERDAACAYRKLVASLGRVAGEAASPRGSPPLVAKVMRHIGGRLVALMHEVSSGESAVASPRPRPPRRARPASATTTEEEDGASDGGAAALPRSRSHDVLEAARARGEERDASDCDRFSWRGSFESALLAADSRGTLGGEAGGAGASRRSAGDLLAAQRTQSRSCGAIGGSEDRLWRGRRRSSAPDAEGPGEEAEARAGSLPRLPSGAAAAPVKSARYRAPGFSRAVRAVSAPGLHGLASRPRRRPAPHAPASPASASVSPSTPLLLHEDAFGGELAPSPSSATLPRRSNSPPPPHDADQLFRLGSPNRSGLQARSESMASVYSGAGEGARGAVSVRGAAQFSLVYNYKLGALEVGVRRCRDLAPVDVKRNRSDPYVKVYLLPDKSKCGKRKTKVKKNTLNPIFEESLRFTQPLDALAARTLWLSVWSADMFGRNDFLGEVTLPLADMLFDDTAPKWYPLQERTEQFDEQTGSKGDVIVGLKFELAEGARGKGTLHVLVKEAKNLVATKPSGLADAFCKSYLLPERGRLSKQKSAVVRRSLSPRWEHAFTYRGVTLHELGQRALELSVWDRDRIASNDFMGGVRFSLGTGTYMGSSVNWMDSVGREVSLWQTMMQRPNFWVEGSVPLRSHLSN